MKLLRTVTMMTGLLVAAATVRAAVVLETEHIDLSINFNGSLLGTGGNPWLLTVRDEDHRNEYAGQRTLFADPERVLLSVPEVAAVQVPEDPRYTAFLGAAGTTLWILPQTQDPSLLFAGTSTENKTSQTGWTGFGVSSDFLTRGVPSATFRNNQITLALADFSGPGDFHLYSTNAFGDPTVFFDTSDGLSLADSRIFSAGNHVHFNWAFSEPGEYEVALQAFGTLNAGSQFTESDVTTFRFVVAPEPSALALMGTATGLTLGRRRQRPAGRSRRHP
jgi:surface-anchored protein